jgi:HD-GYP domain-containing protein (c-di-GMP phosphodiesterase class II)
MTTAGTDPNLKRVRGLELLLRLGLELHSERDFQRLLERIWTELTRVLEAERSSLFLVDEDSGDLYSVIAQKAQVIRIPWGKGIVGAAAATRVSVLIPDAYQDPRFNPEIDRMTGFRTRSILSVPLKNQRDEVLGVAQVLNRLDGRPFDDEDRLLLEALASMAAVAIETVQLYDEQIRATEAVISGLMMALEMRDPQGRRHSQEVRGYARAMAEEMALSSEEVKTIEWAAALHDIGKIAVADRVLTKKSSLSSEEWVEYEAHAIRTREFLEAMAFSGELAGVETIAPYHHKRFEGGGFPQGPPEGKDVPLGARIIAAADALACQMSSRWGRQAMSQEDALDWIRQRAGTDFDPEAVEALCGLSHRLEEVRNKMPLEGQEQR